MDRNFSQEFNDNGISITLLVRDKARAEYFSRHLHDTYELIYFVKCEGEYVIENNIYPVSSGDVMLIPAGKYHFLKPKQDSYYERIVINFTPSVLLLPELLPEAYEKTELLPKSEFPQASTLFGILHEAMPNRSKKEIVALARSCLTALLIQVKHAEPKAQYGYSMDDKISAATIKYISQNIASISCVDDIASALYVSKSSLQHNFRVSMKISLMKYVRMKKIMLARTLITNGALPTVAATQAGFKEYSTFYRCYKDFFGHPPKSEHQN